MKRVLLINDTSLDNHYGSELSSQVIKGLIRENAVLCGCVQVGKDWNKEDFYTADTVIINGEGTFHHQSHRSESLYAAIAHGKSLGKRVALVNSVVECIPEYVNLNLLDYISVREPRSMVYAKSRVKSRSKVHLVPDACFFKVVQNKNTRTNTIVVTDSVVPEISEYLKTLSHNIPNIKYVPFIRDNPLDNYEKIINVFAKAGLVISSRFHASCFAIMTATPVLSLPSNTRKTFGLMEMFSLSKYFCESIDDLKQRLRKPLRKNQYRIKFDEAKTSNSVRVSIKQAIGIK